MLRELQQQLFAEMYENDELTDELSDKAKDFSQNIRSSSLLSAQQRIDIYTGSVTAGLAEALTKIYPVCQRLVGVDFFRGLAYKFVATHPSYSPNLNDYGSEFADFVEPIAETFHLFYLSDVCCLEWAYHVAYNAATSIPMNFAELAEIEPSKYSKLRFSIPEGSSLIASNYPIHAIWQVNQPDFVGKRIIDVNHGGSHLFVTRVGCSPIINELTENEWHLLNLVKSQTPFAEISQKLGEKLLISGLSKLVEAGWITNFHLK